MLRSKRAAFTLIELLVVIAIIAVLIGLLLPAVQKVREAANSAQCQNNLKQIGLALQMYHDTNGQFPHGTLEYGIGGQDYAAFPWGVYILPFIEQVSVYKKFNLGYDFVNPNNNTVGVTFNNGDQNTPKTAGGVSTDPNVNAACQPIPTFQCPSSPSKGLVYTDTWSQTFSGNTNATPPYVGNTSWSISASDYAAVSGQVFSGYYPGSGTQLYNNGYSNGILNDNPSPGAVSLLQISDGTSNTWLVGECAGAPNVYTTGPTLFDTPPFSRGAAMAGGGWADQTNGDHWIIGNTYDGQNIGSGGPCVVNCDNVYGFFSFHTSGTNFLYADGHVQAVTKNIDPVTAIFLTGFNDGAAVGNY
jgi:prepilin-type N-terminal cleavage/methylation domain-containing protein/prepilin-type processing-associated H-X9-DG protein